VEKEFGRLLPSQARCLRTHITRNAVKIHPFHKWAYVQAAQSMRRLNLIFGHLRWSLEIKSQELIGPEKLADGKYVATAIATVKLTVYSVDGTSVVREGWSADEKTSKNVIDVIKNATASAVSAGFKQAVMSFGPQFGLAVTRLDPKGWEKYTTAADPEWPDFGAIGGADDIPQDLEEDDEVQQPAPRQQGRAASTVAKQQHSEREVEPAKAVEAPHASIEPAGDTARIDTQPDPQPPASPQVAADPAPLAQQAEATPPVQQAPAQEAAKPDRVTSPQWREDLINEIRPIVTALEKRKKGRYVQILAKLVGRDVPATEFASFFKGEATREQMVAYKQLVLSEP
jgi:hypothetical protein